MVEYFKYILFDGHGQVIAFLAKLGIVVACVAEVNAIVSIRHVQRLRPEIHVLVEAIEQVVSFRAQ